MISALKPINCNGLLKTIAVFLYVLTMFSCGVSKVDNTAIYQLRFLDEYILEDNLKINKHKIGGLSGIDYNGKEFILISDHSKSPLIYKAKISIDKLKINEVEFYETEKLKCNSVNTFDTESIRFLPDENQYLITGEGNVGMNHNPIILKISKNGNCLKSYNLPKFFEANATDGPRQNGVLEGLSLDFQKNGFWVINELPLYRDGRKPKLYNTNAPLRLSHYNFDDSQPDFQLSYDLDRLIKIPLLPFGINGATEILQIDEKHLLVLERSYSAGHNSNGNRVKIFLVDIAERKNLINVSTLKKHKSNNLKKQLLFDSKPISKELKYQFIDNIEGMTFGPDLENGNKSLILVSDNNFNTLGHQINQFLLLELYKL